MTLALKTDPGAAAVIARFEALWGLDAPARRALSEAASRSRTIPAHRDVMIEGKPITETLIVLDGWAARVRYLMDGRRQILSFVIPGDLLGICDHTAPVMSSTVVAITSLTVCRAPARDSSALLDQCYGISRAIDEANLLSQITRLGRLSAHDRIIDLLLELVERLALTGLVRGEQVPMPLTQEMLADALGLTSVHVNRTLQQARRTGDLAWSGRLITLRDIEKLRRDVGRRSARAAARNGSFAG